MIQDSLHAAILILSILVFFILIWKYRNWKRFFGRIPLAIVVFVLMFIVFGILLINYCCENNPLFQWLIPAGCLFFILLGTENKKAKTTSAIFFILIAAFLSWHFDYLVYHSNYTTNSESKQRLVYNILSNNKERLIKLLSAENKSYPSGWAEELFKESFNAKAGMTYRIIKTNAYRLWHSSFTDLYLKNQKAVYLWYPGGRLAETVDKIEWREK